MEQTQISFIPIYTLKGNGQCKVKKKSLLYIYSTYTSKTVDNNNMRNRAERKIRNKQF